MGCCISTKGRSSCSASSSELATSSLADCGHATASRRGVVSIFLRLAAVPLFLCFDDVFPTGINDCQFGTQYLQGFITRVSARPQQIFVPAPKQFRFRWKVNVFQRERLASRRDSATQTSNGFPSGPSSSGGSSSALTFVDFLFVFFAGSNCEPDGKGHRRRCQALPESN